MPYKPRVYCKSPGCNQLVYSGYCSKHKQPVSQYDTKRNVINAKIYTGSWRKLSKMHLRNSPLCIDCLNMIPSRITAAQETHHIKAICDGGEHEESNLISLCTSCHSKRTKKAIK